MRRCLERGIISHPRCRNSTRTLGGRLRRRSCDTNPCAEYNAQTARCSSAGQGRAPSYIGVRPAAHQHVAGWVAPALCAAVAAAGFQFQCSASSTQTVHAQCQVSPGPSRKLKRMITDHYMFDKGSPVGMGNRSIVTTAIHRASGEAVAVKQIPKTASSNVQVMEEVHMLQLASSHRNVVKFQEFFEDQDAWYIVMELARGGELFRRISEEGAYPEGQAARIMAGVLEAVGFLHAKGLIHMDIKPENLLLAQRGDEKVVLADFGSAFMKGQAEFSAPRDYTTAYSAPEVLRDGIVDEKSDLWAIGVIMYILLSGRHPFDTSITSTEEDVVSSIVQANPDMQSDRWSDISSEAKDLIKSLLSKDPRVRPTASQALAHRWFTTVAYPGTVAGVDKEAQSEMVSVQLSEHCVVGRAKGQETMTAMVQEVVIAGGDTKQPVFSTINHAGTSDAIPVDTELQRQRGNVPSDC